jgi:hypothetical protein
MQDGGNNAPVPLHRPMNARDKATIDEATRDIYHGCRSAFLLISAARKELGLLPLPPMG